MWIGNAATTQTGNILPRQSVMIRATGGCSMRLPDGLASYVVAMPRDIRAKDVRSSFKILFRHRSDTIGKVLVSETLDLWSE